MPLPTKSTRPASDGGKDSDDSSTASNNLWVGNLALDVTDSDLMDLFAQYGALDSVTCYSARSYAFVFFKRVEDAKAAKNALQGFSLRGLLLKIEFARPAKACKQLWVGGISPTFTKEDLEAEFLKFGKIEDFRFFRERNTAFVEFSNLDDATQAMKNMNGRRLGGENIRVDYLRSTSSKKDQLHDSYAGQRRPLHSQTLMGRKGDGQPSNILWIGYPPIVQIDEQMLHNAMILFGEIERIKSYPSRNYSFVEFRSVDEARRAKEGLQGRLFNDPRITIMFSSSDEVPGQDFPGFFPGSNGPRPLQMDTFGHNHPMVSNNFAGQWPPGPNMPMRPFGPHGGLDYAASGPELNEISSNNKMGPNWKRPSPAPGLLSPPPANLRLPARSPSGAWDGLDTNRDPRDSKRSRIDGALPNEDAPFPLRVSAGVHGSAQPDNLDHIWRGLIAKGGTPVCRARCVPLGKGIGTTLPDVVDCSARTGLDILAKHYADAIGFDIVFFLPDSEDDFASYTEFLRYLGAKNRAGVAKFFDSTTLFLVPPSDFLTNVLKVAGPERLYGVVLKFPPVPNGAPMQQSSILPTPSTQYMQQIPAKEEQGLPLDYNRSLHEDSKPSSVHSVAPNYAPNTTASGSQNGVALTPELIATLNSLLPPSTQSSTVDGAKSAVNSLTPKPPFPPMTPNDGNQSQYWKQDHQVADQSIHPPQQLRSMYNYHNPQYQPYPPVPAHAYNAQAVSGSSQNGPAAVSPHVIQQYPVEVSPSTQNGYGLVQGTDPSLLYNSQTFQQPNNNSQPFLQPNNSIGLSNNVNNANPQQQALMPYAMDQINANPQNQQLHASGVGQGTSELEADKNQRYQSTLQFAANLLLQIQQQQAPGGPGPGIQQ